MQAKVIAGPPQIISVAFQWDAWLGGDWFRPAMRTAEALGLAVPPSIFARADELIR
jgi:hypothetical protein